MTKKMYYNNANENNVNHIFYVLCHVSYTILKQYHTCKSIKPISRHIKKQKQL